MRLTPLVALLACACSGQPSIGSPGPARSARSGDLGLALPAPRATPSGKSAGCGKMSPPRGALSIAFGSGTGEYVVSLPERYDPATPLPLIFAFHGRGRWRPDLGQSDWTGFEQELGPSALIVYPRSQGEGWDWPRELAPSLELFDTLFAHVLDDYCVDTARVFAVGHSSGGYFANILGCRRSADLRGVALVAGAAEEQIGCGQPLAALVIHGQNDTIVPPSRGWSTRDYYLLRNGCGRYNLPGVVSECIDYRGCAPELPVTWCEHSEPEYEGTNHGWPSFASRAVASFVASATEPAVDLRHNLLMHSTFSGAGADAAWVRFFVPPASGSIPAISGEACLAIQAPGDDGWDVQIAQRDVRLRRGHRYRLDFRAWASQRALIRPKLGKQGPPYEEYWANRFELGPSPRRFRAELTMGSPDDETGELAFQLGGGYAPRGPVTVCVDDVYLSDPAYDNEQRGDEP
jgi:polyhydroxybutyrate depolymerase